jgi:hypothetical protein
MSDNAPLPTIRSAIRAMPTVLDQKMPADDEIHAFQGEATVDHGNTLGYEPGSRHAVIVFSRQPAGSEHDFALAARRARENGLLDVRLDSAGRLRPEALGSKPREFGHAYESALEQGYGVIVYSGAIG